MPPKDLRNYKPSQNSNEEQPTSVQQQQQYTQLRQVTPLSTRHQTQTYLPMTHTPTQRSYQMDYPSLPYPTMGTASSRPVSYTQQSPMNSLPGSLTQQHNMGSVGGASMRSDGGSIGAVQLNSAQMSVHPTHVQQPVSGMSSRSDLRQPMSNRSGSLPSMHIQQQQQQVRPIHKLPSASSSGNVQQHSQVDAYYEPRPTQHRPSPHTVYPPSSHTQASRSHSQMLNASHYQRSQKDMQSMLAHTSTGAPLSTTLSGSTGPMPNSITAPSNVQLQQSQDLSAPPPRFSEAYDEETIKQRITGYHSKQSSDFVSLLKLIQDSSTEYSCVFSDPLIADLIGASSLSSPSSGHLRAIGLTLQHMLTCIIEKAREQALSTNPEGASTLTDKDVLTALTVLGFTDFVN